MVRICVSGSKGKMGMRILELARQDAEFEVSGEFDIGVDAEPIIQNSDCVIEFTSPGATIEHLALCTKHKKALVIGTTGLSPEDNMQIQEASALIPIVSSPNMSVGVNTLFRAVAIAAKTLGPDYQVSIVEAHHAEKKDAPSGTAKELARIVRSVRGEIKIPIESIREDEIVGEHTITFESDVDTIEFTHAAKTRDIFAKGALTAAKFLMGKGNGLYSMKDVLGL